MSSKIFEGLLMKVVLLISQTTDLHSLAGAGEVGGEGQEGPWPPNKIFNDAFFLL